MDIKLKKTLSKIGVVFATLYILFLISPVIVSPIINSYSGQLEEMIKSSTGLDANLEDISFVTGWNFSAGVKVKKITITEPNIEKNFFIAENAGGKILLLPLILRNVQMDSVFAKNIQGDFVVKENGNLRILDYLPKEESGSTTSAKLPFGFKFSNHLPNVNINKYKLALIDAKSLKSYYVEGANLKVCDFILDKKIKFSTKGKIVFDSHLISNYDLKIYNKIMPDINLNDLIFPQEVIVDDEPIKSKVGELINLIDLFEAVNKNKLSADILTDVNTSGSLKAAKIKGRIRLDALSVASNGKKLPESYLDLNFKGNKTDIDSIFFTSHDVNEKTQIIGDIHNGKNPSIDLTLRSNAKFNNVIRLIDSIASAFGVDDFHTLSATGGIDADFNINSDMKKVSSTGYLKIAPSSVVYGLYNVAINNIIADVDLMNNNVNIKNAGFSIFGHPLNISGTVLADSTTDVKVVADSLSLKGLLTAFGQTALLKQNDISNGVVSLNALIKGKLKSIKPEITSNLKNVNVYNINSGVKISLADMFLKIIYDGKSASGNIDINSFVLDHPSATINLPKSQIIIDSKDINIKNTYLTLNNSRVDMSGVVKDYISDRMFLSFNANGKLNSSDIVAFLPKEFGVLIGHRGQVPLNIDITGNSKVQNVKLDITADSDNYVSLIDVESLKNQKTNIHSNIEIIGDSLNFINTGISNNDTLIAKLSGGVTKLYSQPKLNINISVPNEISFPIWGVQNSNITTNGTVSLVGNAANPNMRGTINFVDISMKDFDFAIKDLVADLSGALMNGSATARSFKAGGIVATDLAANFSLKDFSKFYLTDISAKAFEGGIKGKLSYDINTSKMGVEIAGAGLNSTKAVEGATGIKNALTGVLGFNAKLGMQGITDKEIIESMKGNIDFDINDGRFMGIGRLENLIAAQNVSSNSILKSVLDAMSTLSLIQETNKFKYIKGEMSLANGSANISKILVSGPLMSYYVQGIYNILPNTANLIILGRLDGKVGSALGPLGDLSAEKLLSYIPKFGLMTSNILKQLTSDPASENTALIPELTSGSKTFKDFKVVFNGGVESSASVKSFKWLSTCDTSQMNLKKDLQDATEVVKTNITERVENAKNNVENVKNNVNKIIDTKKNTAETVKQDIQQMKTDIQQVKDNSKQNSENLKNLLKNAVKNAGQKMPDNTETSTSEP